MWSPVLVGVVIASILNPTVTLEREERALPDELPLLNLKSRTKRAVDRHVDVEIESESGKHFRVRAHPAQNLFSRDFRVFENHGNGTVQEHNVDTKKLSERYLEGEVVGEPGSKVVLHHEGTSLSGSVYLKDEVYTIEGADLTNSSSGRRRSYRVKPHVFYEDSEMDRIAEARGCPVVKRPRRFFPTGDPELGLDLSPDKKRCSLRLVADHTYFEVVGESNLRKTIDKMVTQIQRVNKMFNETMFTNEENDGYFNMGFVIRDVLVFREPTEVEDGKLHFNMAASIPVEDILYSFATEESTENQWVCLAHLFTARNLDGALGLASIGHPIQERGICARRFLDSKAGKFIVENVGLSTSVVMGTRLLTRVSDLTVAHELAHGWGAEHDPDTPECMPSKKNGGLYLMNAHSNFGLETNNKLFSPCSIRQIAAMLKYKAKCFVELASDRCGNFIVDDDEECDVGPIKDNDPCCSKSCKLRQDAMCSDMNHACCDKCQFATAGTLCRARLPSECLGDAFCSGETERCPRQKPVPDNETCLDKGSCRNGECIPFCESRGMISCRCYGKLECHRCCRLNEHSPCFPIEPFDVLKDGTMCSDGFCKQGKCQKKVQDIVSRIVGIFQKVSPSWLYGILMRHWSSLMILTLSLIWFPVACCLHFRDKHKYSFGSTPAQRTSLVYSRLSLNPRASMGYMGEMDSEPQKGKCTVLHTDL